MQWNIMVMGQAIGLPFIGDIRWFSIAMFDYQGVYPII